MKKILWMVLFLLLAVPIWGQVPVPYTFVPGTTASATQVNANFDALARNALNLSGGKITGDIIVDPGRTVDGVDISAVLGNNGIKTGSGSFVRPEAPQLAYGWDDPAHLGVIYVNAVGDGFFDLTTTGASYHFGKPIITDALTVTTLTCTGCIKATQLDNLLGAKAGIYGDAVTVARINVDTDGRIIDIVSAPIAFPAIPPSYALGANQIPETAIIDGALLARVASTETITGAWTFTTAPAFPAGSIPESALIDGTLYTRTSTNEVIAGTWSFTGGAVASTNGFSTPAADLSGGYKFSGSTLSIVAVSPGIYLRDNGKTIAAFDLSNWQAQVDNSVTLGTFATRFKNIHLALPPSDNTFPFVIVGDPAANSELAYFIGPTKTCTTFPVVRAGLVISC